MGESDIELLAGSHGFIELQTPYDAMMGDYREWVHLSKVERMLYVADPQSGDPQRRELYVKLAADIPAGTNPMRAHDLIWRRVKMLLDKGNSG